MQSRKVKTLDKLLKDLDANSNIHLTSFSIQWNSLPFNDEHAGGKQTFFRASNWSKIQQKIKDKGQSQNDMQKNHTFCFQINQRDKIQLRTRQIYRNSNKIREGLAISRDILKQSTGVTPLPIHATNTISENKQTNPDTAEIYQSPTLSQNAANTHSISVSKNKERLQNQVLMDGEFVSDDAITMEVEVMKQNSEQFHLFIANRLANILIDLCPPTAGLKNL